MAKKIKLTRPELKRQRDALLRFDRYLPMLKLKQQQLQLMIRDTQRKFAEAQALLAEARKAFTGHRQLLSDAGGVDVEALATASEIHTAAVNVAGVEIPVFEAAVFPEPRYSLFGTPAWVDRALRAARDSAEKQARCDILQRQFELLDHELTKIIQRVNLFEKVKIPEARENIRVIRIHLGDTMTAAVARAKIAKGKIAEREGPATHVVEAATEGQAE